jgi:hypothetical protein
LVRVPSTRPEWFRSFITHLSHAEPLLSCLRWAGGASGVFATPELAELPPLPTATSVLTRRMQAVDAESEEKAGPIRLPEQTLEVLDFTEPRQTTHLVV